MQKRGRTWFISSEQGNHRTRLHEYIRAARGEDIRRDLKDGAHLKPEDFCHPDKRGSTALHDMMCEDQGHILGEVLEKNARFPVGSFQTPDSSGWTPFFYGLWKHNLDKVQPYLDQKNALTFEDVKKGIEAVTPESREQILFSNDGRKLSYFSRLGLFTPKMLKSYYRSMPAACRSPLNEKVFKREISRLRRNQVPPEARQAISARTRGLG